MKIFLRSKLGPLKKVLSYDWESIIWYAFYITRPFWLGVPLQWPLLCPQKYHLIQNYNNKKKDVMWWWFFFIIDWSRRMLKWNFSCFGHSRFFSSLQDLSSLSSSIYSSYRCFCKKHKRNCNIFWCSFWWAFYVKFGVLIIQLLTRLAWFCSTATEDFELTDLMTGILTHFRFRQYLSLHYIVVTLTTLPSFFVCAPWKKVAIFQYSIYLLR